MVCSIDDIVSRRPGKGEIQIFFFIFFLIYSLLYLIRNQALLPTLF
jgi:hypothetical protein